MRAAKRALTLMHECEGEHIYKTYTEHSEMKIFYIAECSALNFVATRYARRQNSWDIRYHRFQ